MTLAVKVIGDEETARKLNQVTTDLRPAMENAIGEGAGLIKRDAQAEAPVRTGRLRAGIEAEVVVRDTVVQGLVDAPSVPYAGIQEERKHFMRGSLEKNARRVVELLERAIEWLVRK